MHAPPLWRDQAEALRVQSEERDANNPLKKTP